MNISWETVLVFIAGAALIAAVAWVTHIKARGISKIIINSLAGGVLMMGLSALNIVVLPVNAFNALVVGVLGLPGAVVVIAAALVL